MIEASKLALIAALAAERATLARQLGTAATIQLIQCGMGEAKVRAGFELARAWGADRVLLMGFAGGLGEAALPGQVLVPRQIRHLDEQLEVDTQWHQHLCRSLAPLAPATEPLVCVPAPLLDVESKAFHAGNAIGCDMESAAILALAQTEKIPAAVVKVVLDGPNDIVPPLAIEMTDADGNFRWPKGGRWVNPRQWWQLARLLPRFRLARQRLGEAATLVLGAERSTTA